jgi:hypothetical protein
VIKSHCTNEGRSKGLDDFPQKTQIEGARIGNVIIWFHCHACSALLLLIIFPLISYDLSQVNYLRSLLVKRWDWNPGLSPWLLVGSLEVPVDLVE